MVDAVALQSGALPDWTAVAPALILALTGLLLLVVDSIKPGESENSALLASVATAGSLFAFGVAGWFLIQGTGQARTGGAITLYGDALVVDGMSLFFTLIFTIVAAMVSIASLDYLADQQYQGEFYSLVVFAATGMSMAEG